MFSTVIGSCTLLLSAFILVEPQEAYDTVNPGHILSYGYYSPRLGKRTVNEDQMELEKSLWEPKRFLNRKDRPTKREYCEPGLQPCQSSYGKRVDASDVIFTFPPFAPRPGRRDTAESVKPTFFD